jgi:hypothetical protein
MLKRPGRLRSPASNARENAIEICFRIMGHSGIVGPEHPLWRAPLPTTPQKTSPPSDGSPGQTVSITYGAYFEALQSYVQGRGRAHIRRALAARQPGGTALQIPDRLTLTLEKHGQFYHPARLSFGIQDQAFVLVLNVAVTATGRAWMASELAALEQVAARLPAGCLPKVYGTATVPGPHQAPLEVFLADWFEDFYEFHLSIDPRRGRQGMVVWDTHRAPYYLTQDQQTEVFRQAAYLLTRAYDPVSTAQIYPWHHASGDFVLRIEEDALDLRLISVRQYAPTLAGTEGLDDEARLMALLVFFLNLTLRNRIDRLDGTGDLAWADPFAVSATVAGVYAALAENDRTALDAFLGSYDLSAFLQILEMVAERYRLMPLEKDLMEPHLVPHGKLLYGLLRQRSLDG